MSAERGAKKDLPVLGSTPGGAAPLAHPHLPGRVRHCTACGALLERMVPPGDTRERLVCPSCGLPHYLDPKVAACTIPTKGGKAVLLKRAIHPAKGKWVFPGGFVDRGEPVEEAALRETREEVSLEVELGPLLGIYSYPGNPVVVIVYAAEPAAGGEPRAAHEASEVRLFAPEEIPWGELAFQSTEHALRDWAAWLKGGKR